MTRKYTGYAHFSEEGSIPSTSTCYFKGLSRIELGSSSVWLLLPYQSEQYKQSNIKAMVT